MGLSEHQIHEDAEKYEHLLSDELLDEVDYHLGSPIPMKRKLLLSQLAVMQKAVGTNNQISNIIAAKLWDLGILPETPILLKAIQNGTVSVKQEERLIEIPLDLAEAVSVKAIA